MATVGSAHPTSSASNSGGGRKHKARGSNARNASGNLHLPPVQTKLHRGRRDGTLSRLRLGACAWRDEAKAVLPRLSSERMLKCHLRKSIPNLKTSAAASLLRSRTAQSRIGTLTFPEWGRTYTLTQVGSYVSKFCRPGPGIYRLIGLDEANKPAVLDRLCRQDHTGALGPCARACISRRSASRAG